ncbi:DNA-directed RNA polymerase subunit alpha [Streptomyces phage Shady]|uniref:DNA-directed RNA polymerase subunit alpha n=1 Tax=Streptomyces phage Shady TaxID=2767585 RepID=A0A873WJW5_9CAUD|nr:DNA-directed RNA polymerase subunit alpha [Streptomyces phage Shady]
MDALSFETITAAQGNDIAATAEIITAMEKRIANIAFKMGASADQRDEFTQVGRIAVWEGLARFNGEDVDSFYAFMHRTIDGKIRDAAHDERVAGATGADHEAAKVFAAMLKESNGDLDVAERLCCTLPPKGRRLSPERAYAARTAWEGAVSLDMPTGDEDGFSLADTLATDYGVPDDLVESGDIARGDRDRKIKTVRAVIDSMGAKQAHVLKATYGIDPVACLGTGAEADAELAAELDMQPKAVKTVRRQAHLSFENRYRKVTGMSA